MPKVHLSKLAHNLCFPSVWRTYRMWWRCSSQVWPNIRMSSKYTTTNELVNHRKMFSICLMKVTGAFVSPKGMTNHSKRPSLALKEVFHTSVGSIDTWWYPDFKSILLKYFSPLSWSKRSSIRGIGYLFWTVIFFNTRYSILSLQVPSFFCTNKIGLPQGNELGRMWPFCSSS